MTRTFHIDGIGRYTPTRIVPSTEIDAMLGLSPGTAEKKSGVHERRYANGVSVSAMGAEAGRTALRNAGLDFSSIDAVVYVGTTREQILPCNAAFIQNAMGQGHSGVPCFDIDATCLSFIVGLDQMTLSLAGGRFKRVLLVSAEIASAHLNPEQMESMILFGDGAIAYVLSADANVPGQPPPSEILGVLMETYGEHVDLCRIKGGISRLPAHQYTKEKHADYCFHMDGRKLFKISLELVPGAMAKFMAQTGIRMEDIQCFVPHQASATAMALMQKRLSIPDERWIQIIGTHGNQISASIPMALDHAIQTGVLKKGQLAMLIGTGAGLAIGMMLLRY